MGGPAHSVPSLGVCDVYCCGSTQRLRGSWRRVAVRFSRRAQRTADDKVHRSVDQKSATVAYGSIPACRVARRAAAHWMLFWALIGSTTCGGLAAASSPHARLQATT